MIIEVRSMDYDFSRFMNRTRSLIMTGNLDLVKGVLTFCTLEKGWSYSCKRCAGGVGLGHLRR